MQQDLLQPLLEIMRKLRSEQGCPWDREQTHESLKPYAIEEAYEVAEAVDLGEIPALVDELGDLLLQVVFHAAIAEENQEFSMQDIVNAICEKMLRRHPHVFADTQVSNSEQVLVQWEEIKALERKDKPKENGLEGVTKALPALMAASKIQSKAVKLGWQPAKGEDAWVKVEERKKATAQAALNQDQVEVEEQFGDFLFAVVELAHALQVEPETALLKANIKFKKQIQNTIK